MGRIFKGSLGISSFVEATGPADLVYVLDTQGPERRVDTVSWFVLMDFDKLCVKGTYFGGISAGQCFCVFRIFEFVGDSPILIGATRPAVMTSPYDYLF